MAADPQTLSDEIDVLLAHYLQLLDEYTSLRGHISTLQSSIYTDIARANFQAERGVSYGQDSYDRRAMRAGELCKVKGDAEEGSAVFEIFKAVSPDKARSAVPADKADGEKCNVPSNTEDIEEAMKNVTVTVEDKSETQDTEADTEVTEDKSSPKSKFSKADGIPKTTTTIPDPLRMFGFSIPSALRAAQSSSVQLVKDSVPRLATVTIQMRALEIQIRRARKYRAKALATEGRSGPVEGSVKREVAV